MARVCDICGKGTSTGHTVSKSKHHTKRVWKPNLLKMKTEIGGTVMSVRICTRCLKSGYLTKKV
ncbi:MAG: 50S ribosomal protein L28 [Treponemataceae bacterium]